MSRTEWRESRGARQSLIEHAGLQGERYVSAQTHPGSQPVRFFSGLGPLVLRILSGRCALARGHGVRAELLRRDGLGRELDEPIFVTSHFGERLGERNNVGGAYT